jgi:hypothetical protein
VCAVLIIAFDCDGTLIDGMDEPKTEMVALVRALRNAPNVEVIIWSGGGKSYAERVARMCGLEGIDCYDKFIDRPHIVDIAFDDDTMLNGVRRLMLLKVGDTPLLPPLGDCRLCEMHRDDEWNDHDFVACDAVSLAWRCKVCGMPHRVYKATHTEEWDDGEFVPICDECAD